MSTITMDKEEAICLNEHRSVVTTVAVSYTHLDVYKRQALQRSPQKN